MSAEPRDLHPAGLHVAEEHLRPSASFPPQLIAQVHEMARTGRYEIRGAGSKRRVPSFDDLTFLTASASRYPL
jgi:methylamine---glutamate N-methyltransferase subunit C